MIRSDETKAEGITKLYSFVFSLNYVKSTTIKIVSELMVYMKVCIQA